MLSALLRRQGTKTVSNCNHVHNDRRNNCHFNELNKVLRDIITTIKMSIRNTDQHQYKREELNKNSLTMTGVPAMARPISGATILIPVREEKNA